MISKIFQRAKADNKTVFIPYFPVGYPTTEKSKKAYIQLTQSGADLIEVGIPFSDPIADGPTIQKASNEALKAGFKVSQAIEILNDVKNKIAPTTIMTYYNLLYRNGLRNFARKAARAGVKGVIVPDLPLEEASEWLAASKDHLETIFLVAPTSTEERIKKIGRLTTAFIYCVSLTGVTGERKQLPSNLARFLKDVKRLTKKPTAVGFGISKREQVKHIQKLADGFIVGSAIIKAYAKGSNERQSLKNIDTLAKKLKG